MTCKFVKEPRIGLEPSSTATNLSIWSLVHIPFISQPLQRKQQPKHQISQGKSKIRWRCDTYLNGMKGMQKFWGKCAQKKLDGAANDGASWVLWWNLKLLEKMGWNLISPLPFLFSFSVHSPRRISHLPRWVNFFLNFFILVLVFLLYIFLLSL